MADVTKVQGADVERAKTIWEVVKTFPTKIVQKSTIIDYLIREGGAGHWQEELEKVKALTEEQKDTLKNTKVGELKAVFESLIKG